MPLTHDFKETIRARAQRDPDFRQALLRDAVECVINGDLSTGKAVLRDYVNATVGFQDRKTYTHSGQEPHAHVGSERQPLGCEPLQHPVRSARDGRRTFRIGPEKVSGERPFQR